MKKNYSFPEMIILLNNLSDVITVSTDGGFQYEDEGIGDVISY